MKIYTYPHEKIGFIDLVDQNNQDIALKVVNSARISYDNASEEFTEKDGKLAKFLWNHEHTCYDSETQVFTNKGWVFWPQITKEHSLAAVDPKAGTFSFEKPKALTKRFYNGNMLSVEQAHVSMLVTPEHRLWVAKRKANSFQKYEHLTAEDSFNKQYRVKTTSVISSNEINKDLPYFLEGSLIGFFLGDGSRISTNRITFHLKKERKIVYLEDILRQLNIPFSTEKTTIGTTKFNINIKLSHLKNYFIGISADKQISEDIFNEDNHEKLLATLSGIWEGLKNSDGSKKRTTWT